MRGTKKILLPDAVHRISPPGREITCALGQRQLVAAWNTDEDALTELELLLYHTSKVGTGRIPDYVQWSIQNLSHGGLDHDWSLRSGVVISPEPEGNVPRWALPANGIRSRFAASRVGVFIEVSDATHSGGTALTSVTVRASLHPVRSAKSQPMPDLHYNGGFPDGGGGEA